MPECGLVLGVEWTFSSDDCAAGTAVRRALASALEALDCDPGDLYGVQVVCGELTSNAARHAARDAVRLSFAWNGRTARLRVSSAGAPFDFLPIGSPDYQDHGRGLKIVAALATSAGVEHHAGINTVDLLMVVRAGTRPRESVS